jgi:hypothetical protein
MDDNDDIDLSVFDSELLDDCWGESNETSHNNDSAAYSANLSGSTDGDIEKNMWGGTQRLPQLPSFEIGVDAAYAQRIPNHSQHSVSLGDSRTKSLATHSDSSAGEGRSIPSVVGTSVSGSSRSGNCARAVPGSGGSIGQTQSSTASNCLPHELREMTDKGSATAQPPGPSATTGDDHFQVGGQAREGFPQSSPVEATPAKAAGSIDYSNLNLLPLAFNALAAGVNLAHLFQAPGSLPVLNPASVMGSLPVVNPSSAIYAPPQGPPSAPIPPTASIAPQPSSTKTPVHQCQAPNTRKSATNSTSSTRKNAPPFLLFDAPVELRHNFIQSQRALGIPVLQDNNSYHFGLAVNGYHPQHSDNDNSHVPKLIDGRHGDIGSKRLKNAKEQKRAQRITDLIEELRIQMEHDGWQVGMKSKLHTLSS